ncbi:hypothetical protein E2C01_066957 [Portunus trituberculatus]|uniref:Uncharacterized protein n=1 Tax=Portunus trituberculatus TaxID=210409 RepID=A0A5B7HSD4_PORTR|nr:hypothetical protein [Portunus trituberculatus]
MVTVHVLHFTQLSVAPSQTKKKLRESSSSRWVGSGKLWRLKLSTENFLFSRFDSGEFNFQI